MNDTIEALQTCLVMQLYNEHTATAFQIPASDDWLRCQQALALPVLPPTTSEACQYFFTKLGNMLLLQVLIVNGDGQCQFGNQDRFWKWLC